MKMNIVEVNDQLLKDLVKHFYRGNLNFCVEANDVNKMDWNWQDTFLEATVNSKLVKQYPNSSQFTKLFLKKLVEYLEPYQEIHDEMYTHLCTTMKATGLDKFCYRHYIIGQDLDKFITMKETRNMVVNGTTGLKTWEAALILSDWALCEKDTFTNKNVLELGSGVGFAGITIGKYCDVKSVFLTDCHEDVLTTIKENIEINFSHIKKIHDMNVTLYEKENKSIGAMMLDWQKLEYLKENLIPDIIIGADIVYDPDILESLCKVLKIFSDKNKHLEVYIASVIRNEDTYNRFLKILDTMNFICEKIEMKESVYIDWDETVKKNILKIKVQ